MSQSSVILPEDVRVSKPAQPEFSATVSLTTGSVGYAPSGTKKADVRPLRRPEYRGPVRERKDD